MAVTTFGTITLVDITDVGELSVYPMSNMPLSVIYDPDPQTFTPNWGDTNLVLTPVVYYAGSRLTLGSTGLTVTWQRQEGSSGATGLTTGETNSNGVLTVSQNKFTANIPMLTYIVTAEYIEPTSNKTLTSQGQITFNLSKLSSRAKRCSISGENVFKYDKDGNIQGSNGQITLNATVEGYKDNGTAIAISAWQFKNDQGTWTKYPGSTTSSSLTVRAEDKYNNKSVFNGNVCTIKLATTDNNVFDYHQITKLFDGAPGDNAVTAVLTNDNQTIPVIKQSASDSGTPDYTSAVTSIIIYDTGVDVTSDYTITITPDSNVTATLTGSTVRVTAMTGNSGNVLITAQKTGDNTSSPLNKTFSLVKVSSGVDGVSPTIYSIETPDLVVNKTAGSDNVVFTPSAVTFYAYQKTGNANKTAYSGYLRIFKNITLDEYKAASPKPTPVATHSGTASSLSHTLTSGTTSLLGILFATGTINNDILDSQSVAITSDGATGAQGEEGPAGEDAINVVMGNYADVIACTHANKPIASTDITIPFTGYKGTTQVGVTCSNPPTILGVTGVVTPGTAERSGTIVYTIPTSATLNNPSYSFSISFSCEGKTVVGQYTITRSSAPEDGTSPYMLQLRANPGYIFDNGSGNISIEASLSEGSTAVTSGVTWAWAKFVSGQWTSVQNKTGEYSGATTSTLTVNGSTVDGYASFRCTATYDSKSFVQYYSLMDKTDPLQCTVLSSVGSQIVNKQGVGALYVRVTQNGIEIDELKTEIFSESDPQNPKSGDYYWKLDKTNKTVTLMKYSGSAWAAAPASDTTYNCAYNWYYRDKDGNRVTPTGLATSGKVIYIDGSFITGKITADVEVVYPKPTS